MKTHSFHVKHPRSGRADDSSIALIITLAVMSLLLVLVLTFATVTRVEIQTATANRDLVASKYLAQAALQRAMAGIASQYVYTPGSADTGVNGIWSEISSNSAISSITNNGFSTNFITDIETVTINPNNSLPVVTPVSDGIIDYVAMPKDALSFLQSVTPQWIGMKGTNGDLIGRIAFLANGASLCINAVGNIDTNVSGLVINTRNQGVSPAEINLVSALRAMGWSYVNATNDVTEILKYRYGPDLFPGVAGVDDDANDAVASHDGIDSDGDGKVDNIVAGLGEGVDNPQEYLSASDGTNSSTITPIGDDRLITDLKQLYTLTNFSAGMRGRFQANFALVQQLFVTQSPIKLDPTLINLNDPSFVNDTNAFFTALTNKFQQISYPTANLADQVQLAANITSYRDTNLHGVHYAPLTYMLNGTNIYGVSRVPHWNDITYKIVLNVTKYLGPGYTNISMVLTNCSVIGEVWYPYTNSAFPAAGGSTTITRSLGVGVSSVSPAGAFPVGFGTLAPAISNADVISFSIPAAPLGGYTNTSQFPTFTNNFQLSGMYSNTWTTYTGSPFNVNVSQFYYYARLDQQAGFPTPTYDEWPVFSGLNPLNTNIAFNSAAIIASVPGGVNPGTVSAALTSVVSVALNDPRVKTNWAVQCVGDITSVGTSLTIGKRNSTNTFNGIIPFNPTATNCDDNLVTVPIPGIGTNTFYIPNKAYFISAAELGRVHRGQPWTTIDFTGRANTVDFKLLNNFTTWNPGNATNATYLHGRINLNTPASQFPIWAGLFGGMPLWDGTYVDYVPATGPAVPMNKTTNLVQAMTAISKYYNYGSLVSAAPFLSQMSNYYGAPWPVQKSDADKEWILNQMLNLTTTRGSGNFFTIWAWGQALKGGSNFSTKTVAAETLIEAMVKVEFTGLGTGFTNANLRIVYFRYNPDLEFSPQNTLPPSLRPR